MKIGLDFDGVISDCGQLKSDAALQLHGLRIPSERFKKELVVGGGLLTADQYRDLQRRIYGERQLGFLMKPVPGVLEYVPLLLERGHAIDVITSRGEGETQIAREWSLLHSIPLKITGVGGGVSKAEACAGYDFYVDDDFDKLKPLVGVVPHRYLFSWGYNEDVVTGDVAQRVASWEELYAIILSLEDTC